MTTLAAKIAALFKGYREPERAKQRAIAVVYAAMCEAESQWLMRMEAGEFSNFSRIALR